MKTLVRALVLRLEQLEAENKSLSERLSRLEEQGVQISENSSQLPSQDRYKKKKEKREKGNRARGGQVGHKGKGRDLYPVEQCDEVYDHRPSQCRCCGENLSGEDGSPLRFFEVALARTQQVAQSILGLESTGVLVTDRYSSYNWMNPHQRQLCWAHLKRDFTAIAQRCGVSATIGEQLLALEQEAFNLWHQFRDQTLSRSELQRHIQPLRVHVKACLEAGAGFEVGYREKTPLA
ncbi:IS66 family transposase, partial [Prochlorothrix hollandica]|uniref:IS66 family transposase n=1 Tax=Prochlorothrix hollandica TaxID=1223 RepID=UPI003340CA5F